MILTLTLLSGWMLTTTADASVTLSCGPNQGTLEVRGKYVSCKRSIADTYQYQTGTCRMPFRYLVNFGNRDYRCGPSRTVRARSGSAPYTCGYGYRRNPSPTNVNETCRRAVTTFEFYRPTLR